IPQAFLAIDGCLLIITSVARGLVVYPQTIRAAVDAELPFIATEAILMAAVNAGGDRQTLHERLRQHSQAAAEQVKMHGRPNDLSDRLGKDELFESVDLSQTLDPRNFVG